MPEVARQHLIAILVLAIILVTIAAPNLPAIIAGNFTQPEATIGAEGEAMFIATLVSGNAHDYDVRIEATLYVAPDQKEDLELIPVVEFKGVSKRMDVMTGTGTAEFFTIPAGQKRDGRVFTALFRSSIPPIMTEPAEQSVKSFLLGQEYALSGRYKAGLFDIGTRNTLSDVFDLSPECKAKFIVECKNAIKFTPYLKSCSPEETDSEKLAECTGTVELCGGGVVVKPHRLDCDIQKADEVSVSVSDGTNWEIKETVKLHIYRRGECTEERPVDKWKSFCGSDALLRNRVFEAPLQ